PEPYTGMNPYEVYRSLGCLARLYEYNSCFRRIEHPGVRFVRRDLNETDVETVVETPVGTQTAVHRKSLNSPHGITLKWEVETLEELKVATWREENAAWEWDQEEFDRHMRTCGDLGAPTMFMPRMNVQCLYIEKMGVEKGVYAMFEWPTEIETFFGVLDESHDRLIDVINPSPVEIINFGENIHAGTLSPDLFRGYHLPACRRRCEKLHGAGKFVTSHWDGDTKPLLPFARETGLDGIEAITPYPQGDVTLEEMKDALGDEIFLLDGIPAIYFDDTYPVETLIECTEKLIELFAPRLVLGISDEISSTGDIERLRVVGDIVDEYNKRVDPGID
ncbi:MAG: uroporphyrinogen decarboxylase family protein, partial [Candidatus Krumholzibacteriota bacterium]